MTTTLSDHLIPIVFCLLTQEAVAQNTYLNDAEQALVAGNYREAITSSIAILADDPDNYAALVIHALAAAELGRHEEAQRIAHRAYAAAEHREDRLRAARIAANAAYRQGHYTHAQWWLRRARNHTATQTELETISAEFHKIRAENPLSIYANFQVAPSDNINNGAADDSFFLEGLDFEFFLPPSSQAISGIEYAAQTNISYTLSTSPTHLTQVHGYLFGRTYSLSAESKAALPDVSGRDYALILAEIAGSHSFRLRDTWGATRISAHAGQVWFSQDPLWNYTRIGLDQTISEGHRNSLNLNISVENRNAIAVTQPDADIYQIGASHAHVMASSDILSLSASGTRQNAETETDSFTDYTVRMDYYFAKPIAGAKLSVFGEIGYRSYPEFDLSLDGRRDRYASAGGTILLGQLNAYGFSPSLTLTARETQSNVTQFTTSQLQAQIGFQSTF
ncbi:tetratricopeptide repeat protein [Loktanella sp. S4079]|uniref:tetratricopeptide repeat protein n=1 Tax=Loktanella sp. S4079 TaxID=579483 RepID=UPI0005F9D397|nr:surface lipoprotein assembly modifier [Loktanella sp. S4079]KJZ21175.1 hypothetical protein TW80_00540 [Loktanella sp. S4079]